VPGEPVIRKAGRGEKRFKTPSTPLTAGALFNKPSHAMIVTFDLARTKTLTLRHQNKLLSVKKTAIV